LQEASRLADAQLERRPAHAMRWTWGDGILLYALLRLAAAKPACGQRYLQAAVTFHRVWSRRLPRIERADACAPALSALWLMRNDRSAVGLPAAASAGAFVERAPRSRIGSIDHLGTSPLRALFPASIWVDTLAMATTFAAQWATLVENEPLLDFATAQPGIYAAKLQDTRYALFRHAYLFPLDRAVPQGATFWLRGNGWVLFALVEMLAELPPDHPTSGELRELLGSVAHALLPWQRDDGAWGAVINEPRSRSETSGTALCAYALARAARSGWLPASMIAPASRALDFARSRMETSATGVSLGDISAATNPMPGWAYRFVPHVRDASWGIGAFVLAAAELATQGARFELACRSSARTARSPA
jgi:rhamnogalacturonyl hydrolase YesR